MPDESEPIPENCIRGIVTSKHIVEETQGASFDVFMPDERTAKYRDDNGEEVSINWEDNDGVLRFTLEERNEHGHYKFPNGAVKLSKEEIEGVNRLPILDDPLSIERDELENNPFHGNIVYKEGLTNQVKKMIAYRLALAVSPVIKREDL